MRLQESLQLRSRSKPKKPQLDSVVDAVGGECKLLFDPSSISDQELAVRLDASGLSLVVPDHQVDKRDIVALRQEFQQLLQAREQLIECQEALSMRDHTLRQICDAMATFSNETDTTALFIESLGSDTKYAVFHHNEVVVNSGFTSQALHAGLVHLRVNNSHSIRVLDGELFAFRYSPYSLVVETTQPISEPIRHLMQLYIRELGHRERTECARQAREKVTEMEFLANHDPLTGLANRRLLLEVAEALLSKDSSDKDTHMALHLDLDGFKLVNDTYGHDVGDKLLVHVAERIIEESNAEDLVARVGGDEFVVVRPNIASKVDAEEFATRLVNVLGIPTVISGKRCQIGASIGIAWCSKSEDVVGKSVNEWMNDADGAMYESKNNGKSAYRVAC